MDEPGNSGETPGKVGWMESLVMGGLIVVVLLILLGWGVIQPKKEVSPAPPAVLAGPPPQPVAEHARAALERFFEGADLEEKLRAVRDPQRVRPMMEDYHGKRGHPYPTMGRVSPGKEAVSAARRWVFFEVEPFSGPRFPVAVEWDGFRFAVDWESLTAYGTMDWAEFLEKRPGQVQTMRIYASEAPESLRPPGMTADERAFRVEHRDSEATIVAVAGGDVAKDLASKVKGKRVPVTAEMAWKGGGGRSVCEIVKVVAEGWSP